MRFRIKKIPTFSMSIGERLKRARRRKKISLEKLEELSKIKKRYLEDIERNDFDSLPSDVYTKGFLFKYAEIVGLDTKEILDQFKQERGLKNGLEEKAADFYQKPIRAPRLILTSKLIISLLVGILFLGFLGYIIFQIRVFAKAPELIITKPIEDQLKIYSSGLTIEGSTNPGASVFINDQPIGIDLNGNFSEEVRLREGINKIKVSARNKTPKETIKMIAASVTLPAIAKESGTQKSAAILDLIIRINPNPVWLSVDVDGKRVFQGVMLRDTSQEFKGEREIILNTGNSGSTNITLNGTDLGNLGREGEVKKAVKYTPDMIK